VARRGLPWLLAALATAPLVAYALRFPPGERLIDLSVYRGGGETVLHGGALYSYVGTHGLLFTYPPLAALLAAPWAVAGAATADVLWLTGTLALLADVSRRLVARALPSAPVWSAPLLATAAAWTEPGRDTLRFGQVGVLLLWLVTYDLTRTRRAGVGTGLAAAIKLTPAIVVPVLWLGGRRRAAVLAAAVGGGLTALAAAAAPGDSWRYWTSAVWDPGRVGAAGGNANPGNQALRGMLLRTGWPADLRAALLVGALGLLLLVGLPGAARALRAGDVVRAIAIAGCLSVALAPVSWIHAQVWLLPAAIAVLAGTWRPRRKVAALGLLLAVTLPRLPWLAAEQLARGGARPLWLLVQDAQGLVVVAAVLTLSWPALLRPARNRAPQVAPARRVSGVGVPANLAASQSAAAATNTR
jgi:alpha-1,2-mannosyltransferase